MKGKLKINTINSNVIDSNVIDVNIIERFWIKECGTIALLLLFVLDFKQIALRLEPFIGKEKDAVEWAPLYELTLQYLQVVIISSLISFLIAFFLGNLVHLFQWKSLKDLLLSLASFGTTFPTIAVIALLVPSLGYGFKPVIVALILYGIFPILVNTINGLDQLDPVIIQASIGLGMTKYQRLVKVELPLCLSIITAGVKTSIIINIAAATVGAVVGAGGLGMPIVSGIRTNDPVLILKGAVPVALIALLANQLFTRLENSPKWRNK